MVNPRQAVTPARASPVSAGPGAVQPTQRDRATARVASPPSSPTNTSANSRPAGRAAPVSTAAAAMAPAARAPVTLTAARLPLGGKSAVRAQPAANRHRAGRSWTWVSSAAMAGPQWRRSTGRVAAAAASSHPGPSRADSRSPACRHQARHSSQAASIAGVPNTAVQMAMSRTTLAGGGSASRAWRAHRQAKGVAATATAASPPTRPSRRVRLMCPPAVGAARPGRRPGPAWAAPTARPPACRPGPGRGR
jgi:hypothetical protein